MRVDTVHQGDLDGVKGVYHINVVDEVTQWQYVGTVQAISEAFLIPVLEALIEAFPFEVKGFHADNGSEYVNHNVAALLKKLHVGTFTKSRARHTNDNALAESKNASVIRKWFGYSHIPARFAEQVNAFNRDWLSPFLNFHRPCLFPTEEIDDTGRVRKRICSCRSTKRTAPRPERLSRRSGAVLWSCGRVLRTGPRPAGRGDSPWATATR